MIDSITSNRALGFLIWFRAYYTHECYDTFQQIAENYGQCKYCAVRAYLMELEDRGYIITENRGKRLQRFVINESKYQQLVR